VTQRKRRLVLSGYLVTAVAILQAKTFFLENKKSETIFYFTYLVLQMLYIVSWLYPKPKPKNYHLNV
jgi:hypothetical protein